MSTLTWSSQLRTTFQQAVNESDSEKRRAILSVLATDERRLLDSFLRNEETPSPSKQALRIEGWV